MAKKTDNVERVKTNIPGFDKLVQGGLVKSSMNLISGGPGTGKTIFCLQYLIEGAKVGQGGLFITFEETIERIHGDARALGWNLKQLEDKGSLVFMAFSDPLGNPGLQNRLVDTIKRHKVKRVVIDSISIYCMLFKGDNYMLRSKLYSFVDLLRSLDCTVIITAEIAGESSLDVNASGTSLSREGMVEFVSDAVITLHNSGIGGEGDRAIRILKMRRTNHEKGPVPMEINSKGIKVFSKPL